MFFYPRNKSVLDKSYWWFKEDNLYQQGINNLIIWKTNSETKTLNSKGIWQSNTQNDTVKLMKS